MTKRVLILMSDTGGGHRAAAEAIRDALYLKYGESKIEAILIDGWRLMYFPLNLMPEFYPWLINHNQGSWGFGYHFSNTARRSALMAWLLYVINARRFKRMAKENVVDVVVSVHSVTARLAMSAWQNLKERPPFITIVTDLVSTHSLWYDDQVELTLVATQTAFNKGLESNIQPSKMKVTGLPIHPTFMNQLKGRTLARAALGWQQGKTTVLMLAGAAGIGSLLETAQAINALKLDIQLVIVAGRNKSLKTKLDAVKWNQITHIYAFVSNMPELMDASDILISKAGPATITEAAIVGLPMILMDAISGQESGNVAYVVENDAGIWAPEPHQVASTLQKWLEAGDDLLQKKTENAKLIARPEAVWEIAETVMDWAEHGLIKNPEKDLWKKLRSFIGLSH